MREVEEQMIGLMRTINQHLDAIAVSLHMIEDRLAELADALTPPEEDDAAD